MEVISLILAGGRGTRLWPLSRQAMPKQLLNLTGNRTLIQETCQRISRITPGEKQWIITSSDYYHQVKNQIKEIYSELGEIEILKEPIGKNTAPAVFMAAYKCKKLYGEDSIMIVLPSDHLIMKTDIFIDTLRKGIDKAKEGNIVTFGIEPTNPETAYGYIQLGETKKKQDQVYAVNKFTEKPDLKTAESYVKEANYLWNSGIFIFHIGTLLDEGMKYCKDIIDIFSKYDPCDIDEVNIAYEQVKSISIDYALMEKTKKAFVIISDFGWSDVGSWKSLYDISTKNKEGNVINGEHVIIDTNNSLIFGGERTIATIGIEDMAIVDTADALMICPLGETQRIREIVEQLKKTNNNLHIWHKLVQRPWGNYIVINEGPLYKIKKITVNPKEKLSRQLHYHRSEHWIVVRGTAKVTCGEETYLIYENQSTYIDKSMIHQLENPGMVPLEIIEVQCGIYLEEDDIVRIDDLYER